MNFSKLYLKLIFSCFFGLLLLFSSQNVFSQTVERSEADTSKLPKSVSKNGLEIDGLWLFFPGAFRMHYTRTLWKKNDLKGELIVGINYDFPVNRDTEGRFSDLSLVTGYRQYFWKGLHLEFNQTTGRGKLENHVTENRNYESFDWLITGYAGYKFNLFNDKLYILPQFGYAGVVYKSNPWKIYEDETLEKEVGETPFPLGSLRIGINF